MCYLALNSLWYWEPVERLKQRSDTVSFAKIFQDVVSDAVQNASKVIDGGSLSLSLSLLNLESFSVLSFFFHLVFVCLVCICLSCMYVYLFQNIFLKKENKQDGRRRVGKNCFSL